ncbi:uncharacterized protein BcabD6B2_24060 [Babesia caballi]|uniref:Uncharacterized protein n=1 Tax=Babesia caballi TaxID=5871 RepID=A0AAV4LS23_BABCB|nr:hypothetical protein, conserved [Babesia caballi]
MFIACDELYVAFKDCGPRYRRRCERVMAILMSGLEHVVLATLENKALLPNELNSALGLALGIATNVVIDYYAFDVVWDRCSAILQALMRKELDLLRQNFFKSICSILTALGEREDGIEEKLMQVVRLALGDPSPEEADELDALGASPSDRSEVHPWLAVPPWLVVGAVPPAGCGEELESEGSVDAAAGSDGSYVTPRETDNRQYSSDCGSEYGSECGSGRGAAGLSHPTAATSGAAAAAPTGVPLYESLKLADDPKIKFTLRDKIQNSIGILQEMQMLQLVTLHYTPQMLTGTEALSRVAPEDVAKALDRESAAEEEGCGGELEGRSVLGLVLEGQERLAVVENIAAHPRVQGVPVPGVDKEPQGVRDARAHAGEQVRHGGRRQGRRGAAAGGQRRPLGAGHSAALPAGERGRGGERGRRGGWPLPGVADLPHDALDGGADGSAGLRDRQAASEEAQAAAGGGGAVPGVHQRRQVRLLRALRQRALFAGRQHGRPAGGGLLAVGGGGGALLRSPHLPRRARDAHPEHAAAPRRHDRARECAGGQPLQRGAALRVRRRGGGARHVRPGPERGAAADCAAAAQRRGLLPLRAAAARGAGRPVAAQQCGRGPHARGAVQALLRRPLRAPGALLEQQGVRDRGAGGAAGGGVDSDAAERVAVRAGVPSPAPVPQAGAQAAARLAGDAVPARAAGVGEQARDPLHAADPVAVPGGDGRAGVAGAGVTWRLTF